MNGVLKSFAGGELGNLARGDDDLLAGFGIDTGAPLALRDRKVAESGKLNLAALLESLRDGYKNVVKHSLDLGLLKARILGNSLDQIGFANRLDATSHNFLQKQNRDA